MPMFLEHLDQLSGVMSPCILQFHRGDRKTWCSVVSSVASGFSRGTPHLVAIPKMIK